jgi:hypothetical protein
LVTSGPRRIARLRLGRKASAMEGHLTSVIDERVVAGGR